MTIAEAISKVRGDLYRELAEEPVYTAYKNGKLASKAERPKSENPFLRPSLWWRAWNDGWADASSCERPGAQLLHLWVPDSVYTAIEQEAKVAEQTMEEHAISWLTLAHRAIKSKPLPTKKEQPGHD